MKWVIGAIVVFVQLSPLLCLAQTPTPDFDLNRDGIVDANDLYLFQLHWHTGQLFTPTSTPAEPTPTSTPSEPSPTSTPSATPGTPTPTRTRLPADLIITLTGEVTLEFMRIPSGSFEMGFPQEEDTAWASQLAWERPIHTVTINYDYYLQQTEITQAQWKAVMGTDPSFYAVRSDDHPVERVSWEDAQVFIGELNQLGQGVFRLPSEAEWEYACRAGTTTRFYFGDSDCDPVGCVPCELDHYAWWCTNSRGTSPVARLLPNAWGLYDLYGNVYEWCEDTWLNNYNNAPTDGSARTDGSPDNRVTRGSWRNYPEARRYRSGFRTNHPSTMRHDSTGFRLLREMDE